MTYFDHQFLFISGSLKNDVLTPVSHIKLQTSVTQQSPSILLIYMTEFTVKCPVIACTETAHDAKSHGEAILKKMSVGGNISDKKVNRKEGNFYFF